MRTSSILFPFAVVLCSAILHGAMVAAMPADLDLELWTNGCNTKQSIIKYDYTPGDCVSADHDSKFLKIVQTTGSICDNNARYTLTIHDNSDCSDAASGTDTYTGITRRQCRGNFDNSYYYFVTVGKRAGSSSSAALKLARATRDRRSGGRC